MVKEEEFEKLKESLKKHLPSAEPFLKGMDFIDPTYGLDLIAHTILALREVGHSEKLAGLNVVEIGFGPKETDMSLPVFAKEGANVLGFEISEKAIALAKNMGLNVKQVDIDSEEGGKIIKKFKPHIISSCRMFEPTAFMFGEESEPMGLSGLMSDLMNPPEMRMDDNEAVRKAQRMFKIMYCNTASGTIHVHLTSEYFIPFEAELKNLGYNVLHFQENSHFIPAQFLTVFVRK